MLQGVSKFQGEGVKERLGGHMGVYEDTLPILMQIGIRMTRFRRLPV